MSADKFISPLGCVSLSNPEGEKGPDLPLLLRRVADLIEEFELDPVDISNLVIESEINEYGPWWSATLYWSPSSD